MIVMQEEYFTVAEIAERFKVSRQAVYDWIKEGKLKAIKVGNRTRISRSAIEDFIRPVEPGEPLELEGEE